MTQDIIDFIAGLDLDGTVLDVGCMDVNGSVRPLFSNYLGVDMREGNGVDIVASAAHLPFVNDVFDNVLCLEMLEHDATFWLSVPEMIRVLKPGGVLVLTSPGINFPHHDYPSDYWRFTPEALASLCDGLDDVQSWQIESEMRAYCVGRKPGVSSV